MLKLFALVSFLFDEQKLHFHGLLDFCLTVSQHLFILEHLLPMLKSDLINLPLLVFDSHNGLLLLGFQLVHFFTMHLLHLVSQLVDLFPVFLGLLESNLAHLKLLQLLDFLFKIDLIFLFLLSFEFFHSFLQTFEGHSSLDLDFFHQAVVDVAKLLVERQTFRANVLSLAVAIDDTLLDGASLLHLFDDIEQERSSISEHLNALIVL